MNKTATLLKRLLNPSQILSDFDVLVKDKTYHFDNLLVCKYGVFNVVTINKKGELYGNEYDEFFALVNKKLQRERIPNLIKTTDANEQALRTIFAKEKVYNIKIESMIVIEDKGCKPMFSSQKIPLFNLSTLKKHLKQDKFQADNNTAVDNVLKAIDSYKQN